MKQKRLLPLFLCLCLLFVLPVKVSAADNSEQMQALLSRMITTLENEVNHP